MSFSSVIAFWMVSLLFVITPGADWAYAINAGLRNRVVPAVLGLLAGHVLATVVVAAGVGTLVASEPAVLTVLTVVGSVYLAWLGFGVLRHPATPYASGEQEDGSPLRWAAKGLGVSGLNPKVFLLFLALLPQFTSTAQPWPVGAQIAGLGGVHVASCAVVYLLVGFGAGFVLRARPGAARWVSRISGIVMVVLGLVLLGERVLVR